MGLTSPNKTQILLLLPTTLLLILLSLISSAAIAIAAVVVSKDDNPIMDVFMAAVTPTPYGWSSATHFCDWRGVECDTKNRVISLTLPSQSLSGTLPSSLNSLSHLTTLSLQNNHFSGLLPSFANLSRLRKLYLHNNSFTSVPTGAFSGLINLQILSLSNNADLSSWRFPSELSDSPKMVALYASNANIVGSIPDIFRDFTRLVNLTLSYNNLTGSLPGSFNGTGIQILKLDNQNNGMTGNIDILSGMHNLSVVWLNGNKFSGIVPPSLVYLPNLTDVRLERNNFIGPIPAIPHLRTIVSNSSTRNDNVVGSFNCRRCKVFIRADVGNVGVARPTEDSSSGNKTNVGEVVGLSFLLVFSILVFVVCICCKRKSASEAGVHQQQTVVQGGERIEENPLQFEIVCICCKRTSATETVEHQQQTVVQRGVRKEENPQQVEIVLPLPPPPHRDGVMRRKEPQPPLQDGVPGRIEEKQPPPAFPQERILKRNEGKQQQQPLDDEEVVRRRERVRKGKQIQQQQQDSRDEQVERQDKRGRDEKQAKIVAKDNENSLGLPNKYTYEDLKIMTNEFHSKNNIGEGTFGTVYRGTLSDGTTMVAVKCLKFVGQNDFKNEVEALGRTDHPNLVKLIGYCAESLLRVLVYEYMSNGSLEKWIFHASSRRLLTWPEMKNIIQGIAKGLLHLHGECDKKIFHRDLKPSNVVLDENKNAKLCDFGFAKLLEHDQNSTSTGYAGTPAYMAPEVKQGDKITEKIDVYSFGILVLEVLFGKRYCYLVRPGHNRVEENELPYLMNKNLSEEMRKHSKEVEKIGKLAVWCIHEKPENRPRMSTIVDALDYLNKKFNVPQA